MLNQQQHDQLLKPLNEKRVAKRQQAGRSLSYLESWDVKAHLIRIFGFGAWSSEVVESALAFEDFNEEKKQWNVGYKVTLRLTIMGICPAVSETGALVGRDATYTESAVGSASLPQRGEAHDMAIKTAESDALKRAAINLGTQFGLSLYDNGSLKDVVGVTLDRQVESTPAPSVTGTSEPVTIPDSEGAAEWFERIKAAVTDVDAMALLMEIKKEMNVAEVNGWAYQNITLGKWLDRAVASLSKKGK